MKRQLFTVLVCMTMFAVTSCGEKKGKDKFEERIEKAKESVEDVVDDAKDQIEDKADEVGETLDKAKSKIEQAMIQAQTNWSNHNSLQRGNPVKIIQEELRF